MSMNFVTILSHVRGTIILQLKFMGQVLVEAGFCTGMEVEFV